QNARDFIQLIADSKGVSADDAAMNTVAAWVGTHSADAPPADSYRLELPVRPSPAGPLPATVGGDGPAPAPGSEAVKQMTTSGYPPRGYPPLACPGWSPRSLGQCFGRPPARDIGQWLWVTNTQTGSDWGLALKVNVNPDRAGPPYWLYAGHRFAMDQ